jgi:hypothetical protein
MQRAAETQSSEPRQSQRDYEFATRRLKRSGYLPPSPCAGHVDGSILQF